MFAIDIAIHIYITINISIDCIIMLSITVIIIITIIIIIIIIIIISSPVSHRGKACARFAKREGQLGGSTRADACSQGVDFPPEKGEVLHFLNADFLIWTFV